MTKSSKNEDIRWLQRFSNFKKALNQLQAFIEKKHLSRLEEQGLIKAFEYTYELAWNTIKDFYESQGETGIQGIKDAIRLAFKRELIKNGETWMDMIQSRIQTAHTYNEDTAREVVEAVTEKYFTEFQEFKSTMSELE